MNDSSASEPRFVDSNIWLYTFIQQNAKKAAAQQLVKQNRVCLSSQVVNEICRNLVRKAAFDEFRLRQVIERFYFAYLAIDLNEQILLAGSDLRLKYNFSLWDGLIVAAALAANATVLYSEDMHNGLIVKNKLKIVNPF